MTTAMRGRGRSAAASETKTKQTAKISELRDALVAEGLLTLEKQAEALGLGRSTAWTILKAQHKASGLTATTIKRILAAPQLPRFARVKILEYVEEKARGLYGHNEIQRRRFNARLAPPPVNGAPKEIHECSGDKVDLHLGRRQSNGRN